MEWEQIDKAGFEQRAKIFGGWIVKVTEGVYHNMDGRMDDGWDWRIAITFVPDPCHVWEINKNSKEEFVKVDFESPF